MGSNCIHGFHNILKGRRLLDFLFMQVFINLCYCEKVGNPVPTSDAFRRGTQWEIPYTLGTPSKEKDKGLISSQQQFLPPWNLWLISLAYDKPMIKITVRNAFPKLFDNHQDSTFLSN